MTASENRIGELRRLLMELRSDVTAMKELAAFANEIYDQIIPRSSQVAGTRWRLR